MALAEAMACCLTAHSHSLPELMLCDSSCALRVKLLSGGCRRTLYNGEQRFRCF